MDYSKYGSDKETEHQYFSRVYENLFGHLKGTPVTFLELGLWGGGCMKMWQDFFACPDTVIVGLDKEPIQEGMAGDGRFFYQGDQIEEALLDGMSKKHGPWDVIIDDASHAGHPTFASLMTLWKHLKHNGIYVVEDIFYAWPHAHNRQPDGDGQMINVLHEVIKNLPEFGIEQFHIDYWGNSGVLWLVKATST